MLFITQGKRLVTNFYAPRAAVIFNQFVQQLHKLIGMSSKLTSTQLDALWMQWMILTKLQPATGLCLFGIPVQYNEEPN